MMNGYFNSPGGGGGGAGGGDFAGGYMASPPNQTPGGGGGGQRDFNKQTIIPVTLHQIHTAAQSAPDAKELMIDGVEVTMVTVVGCITNFEVKSTNTTLTIEDGTGVMEVTLWGDDGNRMAIQEFTYVRVHAKLQTFQGRPQLSAFKVRPIIDFNEISHHMLSVMNAHYTNTHVQQQQPAMATGGGMWDGNTQQLQGGVGGFAQPQQGGQGFEGQDQFPLYGDASEFTPLQAQVLGIFQNNNSSDEGVHVRFVFDQLLGVDRNDIRTTIDWLSGEGHLYSTVDDEHFKCTN